MIRKFNYTGRKKIDRSKINIQLIHEKGRPPEFNAEINLAEFDLPENTAVYIEARDKSSYMRFPFGTILKQRVPEDRSLSDIQSELVSFRIKLVDESGKHGLILASSDIDISTVPEPEDKTKIFILPMAHADIGNQIWNIDFDRNKPHLLLNSKIDFIDDFASSPYFLGLVFPAVVRMILTQALIIDDHQYDDSGFDDWRDLWIRFINSLPGIRNRYDPEEHQYSDQEKINWIEDDVIPAFCTAQNTLELFNEAINGGGNK